MKRIFSALASLLVATSAHAAEPVAPEYVSMTCPAGDITLRLENDKSFVLTLQHWDSSTHAHTKTETIAGVWSYSGEVLTLNGKGQIVYRRNKMALKIGNQSGEIDAFTWLRSSSPTFADSFELIERVAGDKLFLSTMPNK